MRQANLIMMSAAMLLAACGGTKDAGKTDQVLIEKSDIKIEGKRMTPEAPVSYTHLTLPTTERV